MKYLLHINRKIMHIFQDTMGVQPAPGVHHAPSSLIASFDDKVISISRLENTLSTPVATSAWHHHQRVQKNNKQISHK